MKTYEYEAVVLDGDTILCTECLLVQGIQLDDERVQPIFADSEWDYAPVCEKCGMVHDYMTILCEV